MNVYHFDLTRMTVAGLLLWLCTVLCLPNLNLYAQLPQGVMAGQIHDAENSQAIEGVEVKVTLLDGLTVTEVSTDSSGNFRVLALAPGLYELRFRKAGHFNYVVKPVRVESSRTSFVAPVMKKGQSAGQSAIDLHWSGTPMTPWGSADGSVFERWQLDYLPSPRNIWALL